MIWALHNSHFTNLDLVTRFSSIPHLSWVVIIILRGQNFVLRGQLFREFNFWKWRKKTLFRDFCDEIYIVTELSFYSLTTSIDLWMDQNLLRSFNYTKSALEAPLNSKRTKFTIKRTKFLKIYHFNNMVNLRLQRKWYAHFTTCISSR